MLSRYLPALPGSRRGDQTAVRECESKVERRQSRTLSHAWTFRPLPVEKREQVARPGLRCSV